MSKTCKKCNKRAYSDYCFEHKQKPKIRRISKKTYEKNRILRYRWYKKNKPDENGNWICYLQISSYCPIKLTQGTLTLEHVESKVRSPEKKFDVGNIRPSCSYCNKLKGSKSLEELSKLYPQLKRYLVVKN